jgi:hypothetical protein
VEKGTGRKKPAIKPVGTARKAPSGKKKDKDREAEVVEKVPARKRPKKPVSDSDEYEDLELHLTAPKANTKLRDNDRKSRQDSEVEHEDGDMGIDSDVSKIPSDPAGFDMSEDEDEGSLAYPFIRDRYRKKKDNIGSARSKAASAAVKRAEDGSRVIDLDSFD